ncbi:MAG: ABC transporter permease [Bacteroidota bacterium]
MLKNFLKIAFRNLLRHKFFSLANIISFSIGLASLTLVSLYVFDEFSFDTFQSKSKQTYRLATIYNKDSTLLESALTPFPLAQSLQKDYPGLIENHFRLFNFQNPSILIEYKKKHYNEKNFFITDSAIFDAFDFEFITGGANFNDIKTAVISESIKKKYFGHFNPIGKELLIDGVPVKVVGVYKDLPGNSHVKLDILVSFETLEYMIGYVPDSWLWNSCWTYIVLEQEKTQIDLESKFSEFIQNHYDKLIKDNSLLFLQPLQEIHLNSSLEYEIKPNNRKLYLFILLGIAGFLLLVSIINFLNLRTTDSLTRVKESGIRKVLGSNKPQLITQFIIESMILSFAALVIAFFIVEAFLPVLNHLTDKNITFNHIFNNHIFTFILWVVILTGLIVGINAGLFASSCPAVHAIRFKKGFLHKKWLSGRFLILTQYTLALILLIMVLVNFKQLHYLKNTDLGFEVRNTVILPVINTPITEKYPDFKNYLLASKRVENVTALDNIIGNRIYHQRYFYKRNNNKKVEFFPLLTVRHDFLKTFNIKLLAGSDFSKGNTEKIETAKNELIINETLSKLIGFESVKDAINQPLTTYKGQERIVGVIKDFNTRSLHKPVSPLIIKIVDNEDYLSEYTKYVAVKFKKVGKNDLKYLFMIWKKFAPNHPFEYGTLNSILDRQYKNEDILNYFLWLFSALLIIISSIGIWALTSFFSIQRTKEIGIRKAIGAMEQDILILFTKDFIGTIIAANIIAWPIAYFILKKWLTVFAYRTNIDLWIFVLATFFMLFLTFSIIWFYALKTSSSNPVDALRDE